jgi:mannose-1-phosphate guanylyltransferase
MRVVLPFILCGGAGTRLWPLSRSTILANCKHRFLIADQGGGREG